MELKHFLLVILLLLMIHCPKGKLIQACMSKRFDFSSTFFVAKSSNNAFTEGVYNYLCEYTIGPMILWSLHPKPLGFDSNTILP